MSEVTLRNATERDLQTINDIYNHYVLTCTCTFQTESETPAARSAWFAKHDSRCPVIVAETGGHVVAWASLSAFHERAAYQFTVEDSIYVRPEMQGRGLGRRLAEELIARAQAAGHHSIIASICSEQIASIALHEKLGFARVAHFREVGHKFGRWLDVVYLQKMLQQDLLFVEPRRG